MVDNIDQSQVLIKEIQVKIDQLMDEIPTQRLNEALREKLRGMLKGQTYDLLARGLGLKEKTAVSTSHSNVEGVDDLYTEPALLSSAVCCQKSSDMGGSQKSITTIEERPMEVPLHSGLVEAINEQINKLSDKQAAKWSRPNECPREGYKPVSTIEERLQKLKDRGISIDLEEEHALKILKDRGYHVLKEYAKPFVDQERTKEVGDGKDYYQKGTPFSLLNRLYYADHEIRGVLFDAIAYIEDNLRNILDLVCSQQVQHHLWYLDPNAINFNEGKIAGMYRPKFSLKLETLRTLAGKVRKREKTRETQFKTYKGLPYAYEALGAMHLGALNSYLSRVRSSDSQNAIAQHYDLETGIRCFRMLSVVVELRNAVAHNECLFLRDGYGELVTVGPLFCEDRHSCSLADAILVVQYFLSKISCGGSRVNTMRENLKSIFADYSEAYPKLKHVFQMYYAYDIYMAETEEDLRGFAERGKYQFNDLRNMMRLGIAEQKEEALY